MNKSKSKISKIISGGQTGVDRAALDFALHFGISCGGYCPAGRRAEDGQIPLKYPLTELDTPAYNARTRRNVEDSDGTLIISSFPLTGGTSFTEECCRKSYKPCFIIDPQFCDTQAFWDWTKAHDVEILNVAGPRESTVRGIYKEGLSILKKLFDA